MLAQVDTRFQVSELNALLDLFNQANSSQFALNDLRFTNIRPILSTTPPTPNEPNTLCDVTIVKDGIDLTTTTLSYRRLDISIKIPVILRYLWDRGNGTIGAIQAVRERLLIQFTSQFTRTTTVDSSNGSMFYRFEMLPTNPIWIGNILFESVSQDQEILRDAQYHFDPGDVYLPEPPPVPGSDIIADELGGEIEFVFTVPITTWDLNHELDAYPDVMTLDVDGSEIHGDVAYPSKNIARVTWGHPQAGTAILR